MRQWSKSSKSKLDTCHPELQLLANEVLKIIDCTVVYGHRNEEEQNRLFADKKSKLQYPDSNHNSLPSVAIDLIPYIPGVEAYDREYILFFSGVVLGVAAKLYEEGKMTHKIRWGGNWSTKVDKNFKTVSFFDGGHYELRGE